MTNEQIEFANQIESKFKDALNLAQKDKISEKEFTEKLTEIKNEISKSEKTEKIESIEKQINELSNNFKSFVMDFEKSKTQSSQPVNDYLTNLKNVLDKMVDQVKTGTRGTGRYSLTKQVGTFTGANVAAGIPQPQYDPGVNDTPKRTFVLRALSNVGTILSDVIKWVEKVTGEGGAGMTAEGTAKTQVDWDYALGSADVKKITSYIKISEEMLADLNFINSEINNELSYLINKKEEDQLLAGVGTTVYLNGITKYAQTLDLASLNGTVPLANEIDCLGAAITQIYTNMEGSAVPNAIVLNPVDQYILKYAQKTNTGEYLMPTFFMADGTQVDGVRIYTSTAVTAGNFLVADMNKFYVKDREPLRIEFGWENDDFTKNLVTIRGEKRLVSYVKANDVEAFIYDSFVNAKAFLMASS